MQLKNIKKNTAERITNQLSPKLIKDPIFMYFCSDMDKRQKFINAFFGYYLYEWSEYDTLLCSENRNALITLINPRTFEYRFKGKGAHALKRFKSSKLILFHRKTVRGIVHIIAPGSMNPRVLTIYGNAATDFEEIECLIDEAIELSKKENITLVYETFSQKLIPFMETKGFSIAYQKQYSDTRFTQTIMTFMPNTKPAVLQKDIEEYE